MRIAIVNADAGAVAVLHHLLVNRGRHQVAWVAHNGAEAVDRAASDIPDLLLMDLMMPVMNGVEATRRIMAASRCPILIVGAAVEGQPSAVYEALGAGALDAAAMPTVGLTGSWNGAPALLEKIARIDRTFGPVRDENTGPFGRHGAATAASGAMIAVPPLVGVGASAGGPAAIAAILHGLPREFFGAVVIVQHLDPQFVNGMVEWIAAQSAIPVRVALAGDRPAPGVALVARSEGHLVLDRVGTLRYSLESGDSEVRPSVDLFFKSMVAHWHGRAVGVVLTGMGRDGASGLRALRESGATTIVQDRESSAVFGMPKAAAQMDAASDILPLAEIAPRLASLCGIRPSSAAGMRHG
jgi:two-component system response regulator WspF